MSSNSHFISEGGIGPEPAEPMPAARAFELTEQAARCRRLAENLTDARTVSALTGMADEYEARARTLGHA